jgi:hypothetical protein
MKKLIITLMIAALTFYLYSCEKEVPTQMDSPQTEFHEPLLLENNPENPDVPEATVAIKPAPISKSVTTVTDDPVSTLEPESLSATLKEGESVTEHKVLTLPADITPPKADILFALDLTGSMGGELSNAKSNSINIMNALAGLIGDAQFGVVSHMDYNGYFSACGYSARFGGGSDYPYSLDQSITANITDVSNAISGLVLGSGYDGPESYTRVLYETYSDANIGWRAGSKKIVVFWMDNIPHDCDVYEPCSATNRTTGTSPGRDGIIGNADDLDFQTVLSDMSTNNVTLLALASGAFTYWDCWAQQTGAGGQGFQINSNGTIPGGTDIASAISDLVSEAVKEIDNLQLEVCTPGFEGWLVDGGATYEDIFLDEEKTFEFDIEIQAPEGTPDGEYCFQVCAVGDGVEYAYQDVCITVRNTIDVSVDVHPTSCPNPFNMNGKGTLPAAILGTADFDVTQIDASTVTIMGVPATRSNLEDVAAPYTGDELVDRNDCTTEGADGFMDMTFKFDMQAVAAALGGVADGDEVVVEINGQLLDGTDLVGHDVIWIKNKK